MSLVPLDSALLSLFLSPSPEIQAPGEQGLGLFVMYIFPDSQSVNAW